MASSKRVFLMIAFIGLLVVVPARIEAQGSDLCQTRFGICPVRFAPIGSGCYCGGDPGRIIAPAPNWNDACGTVYGVCRVNPAPINSPCYCGRDPGRITGR